MGLSTAAVARGGPKEVPFTAIPHPDVEVFMSLAASAADVTAVDHKVRGTSGVRRFAFLDHDAALREFQRVFRNNLDLLSTVTAADLPISFRLDLVRSSEVSRVSRLFRALPGVDRVIVPPQKPTMAQLREAVAACRARDFDVEVFMRVDATADQIDAVRAVIEREPSVTVLRFLDHDAALQQFRKLFARNPDVTKGITGADLPESFQLRVSEAYRAVVEQDLRSMVGVAQVVGPTALCQAVSGRGSSVFS